MYIYIYLIIFHSYVVYIYFILFLQTLVFHLCEDECNKLSIISYLNEKKEDYQKLLPSLQCYVKFQSYKQFTSIETLEDISNIPLFVCYLLLIYL